MRNFAYSRFRGLGWQAVTVTLQLAVCTMLILLVVGLLFLDILAMRYGVDSRLLDVRGDGAVRADRSWWPSVRQAPSARPAPALRVRVAYRLRALAVRIDPVGAPG